jgi:hypothetical protein
MEPLFGLFGLFGVLYRIANRSNCAFCHAGHQHQKTGSITDRYPR